MITNLFQLHKQANKLTFDLNETKANIKQELFEMNAYLAKTLPDVLHTITVINAGPGVPETEVPKIRILVESKVSKHNRYRDDNFNTNLHLTDNIINDFCSKFNLTLVTHNPNEVYTFYKCYELIDNTRRNTYSGNTQAGVPE